MHAGVRRIHSVNTPRLVDEGNLLTGDSKDIPCSPRCSAVPLTEEWFSSPMEFWACGGEAVAGAGSGA